VNHQLETSLASRAQLAKNFDWSQVKGIDSKTSELLQSYGIRDLQHLQSLPSAKRETLFGLLKENGIHWNSRHIDGLRSEFNLPNVSGPAVNWSTISGVDSNVARELGSLGIKNVEQLEAMSAEDRQRFSSRLSSKGLNWDWNWLKNWKTGAAGIAGAGAAAIGADALNRGQGDSKNVPVAGTVGEIERPTFSRELGFALPNVSGPKVDWTTVKDVDPKVAAELNSLGIKNVEQLEALSSGDRVKLETRLRSKGLSWNWGWLSGWKTGLAGSGSPSISYSTTGASYSTSVNPQLGFALPNVSGPSVDWSKVQGVDPKVGAELSALGIKNVEQLEALPAADRAKLEAKLKSKGLSWDWGWLTSWKAGLAGLAGIGGAAKTHKYFGCCWWYFVPRLVRFHGKRHFFPIGLW